MVAAPCLGACAEAPAALVGRRLVGQATPEGLADASTQPAQPIIPIYEDLTAARQNGRYARLADCLAGRITREAAIATLSDAGLRGLGGPAFPPGGNGRSCATTPPPG